MRLAIVLAAGAFALAGRAAAEPTVELRDAVARLVVIPEARADIKVEVLATHPQLPLRIRASGEHIVVSGDVGRRIRGCAGAGAAAHVRVTGIGEVPWRQLPQVVVRTPRDVRVTAGGAVFGVIGRAATVELGNAGCGDWVISNTAGLLQVVEAGSGRIRTGTSGRMQLKMTGSGDVDAAAVLGGAEIDVGGSGDVTVASVNGPLNIKVAGAGDVNVKAGRAPAMVASIAGSGDVGFGGSAGSLKARITGSGDIAAARVTGPISSAVLGSGRVLVGGYPLSRRP